MNSDEVRRLVLAGEPLPDGLTVSGFLDLGGCTGLTSLPERLTVGGWLNLGGCTGLTSLPERLTVSGFLYLSFCTGLTSLPDDLTVGESLDLGGCTGLTSLPEGLSVGGWLDLNGCSGLTSLPEGLTVGGWLDLNGCSGLTSVPERLTICGDPVVIPIVEDLDRKVADAVGSTGYHLEMRVWHTCDTTHCRGGWAIHLAGQAGHELEQKTNPEVAATLIYVASAGYVPDFFARNEAALRDIQARGK